MSNKYYLAAVERVNTSPEPMRTLLLAASLALSTVSFSQELISQEFHDNGRLRSTYFSDGKSVHFMTYYESGRLHEIGSFVDGRRNGVWKQYEENGAVLSKAEFIQGERRGTWEFRDPANVLKVRLEYSNGRLAKGEQFGETGDVIAQRTY